MTEQREHEALTTAEDVAAFIEREAEPAALPAADGYGDTEFGYTFVGIDLEEGDKRLMAMLVRALGTDHPAIDDMTALLFRSRALALSPDSAAARDGEQQYRLLTHADVIEDGDEWLQTDARTWRTDVNGIWVGRNYIPGALMPARRRTDAALAAQREGGAA
ncbi:hypothetical protein [Cupriavidus malaysiensis]|uniref:Uncharacterized protein n=1 Tax=Cupriavidus malaysiensis TaxID=367825 RepID=A0ABM6F5K1_9BURK|nr:hypothetical protein [Cupriavidus malaysiensis]AOZ06798.1 hypothetical protein BKK80_13945 [Cupriavidus malaysiensis]